MSDFLHQINNLSAAEKAELLDAVSLTDAQRAELDHRIARHQQNPSDVVPWEQGKDTQEVLGCATRPGV